MPKFKVCANDNPPMTFHINARSVRAAEEAAREQLLDWADGVQMDIDPEPESLTETSKSLTETREAADDA